jgi:hypothetical protein
MVDFFGVSLEVVWAVLISLVLLMVILLLFSGKKKIKWEKISGKKIPVWLEKSGERLKIKLSKRNRVEEAIFDKGELSFKARAFFNKQREKEVSFFKSRD